MLFPIITHQHVSPGENTGHSRFTVKLGDEFLNGSLYGNTDYNHENRTAVWCFTYFNNHERGKNENRTGSPSHHRSEEACIIFLFPPHFPSNNPWEFERHPLICSSSIPPAPPLHLNPLTLPPSSLCPDVSRIGSHIFRSRFILFLCISWC